MEDKVFDCGCSCSLESDDSDPTRTCDVWDMSRCAAHSVSASDAGPIAGFIQSYIPTTPNRKMEVVDIPPARIVKVPARLAKRREYYAKHLGDYGKYELARLRKMLAKEQDIVKIGRIMKRIEKREKASVEQIGADVADTVRRDGA